MRLEEKIYHKLSERNEEGLELLYTNYSEALFGIAFRVLNHRSYAEDALQKSFLKIWKSIGQYDPKKATLFTWMSRIVRNTSIDIRRLKSFQNEEKSESVDSYVNTTKIDAEDSHAIDAKKLLSVLDDKYSFVLEYLYLRGYTQRELSDEFDIPLGTIKTRVKKGFELLRKELKDEKSHFLSLFI